MRGPRNARDVKSGLAIPHHVCPLFNGKAQGIHRGLYVGRSGDQDELLRFLTGAYEHTRSAVCPTIIGINTQSILVFDRGHSTLDIRSVFNHVCRNNGHYYEDLLMNVMVDPR